MNKCTGYTSFFTNYIHTVDRATQIFSETT